MGNDFSFAKLTDAFKLPRYFQRAVSAGVTYFGILKRWTGIAWEKEPLKTYLTGSWQSKPLKRWTGTEWKTIDTTGV
jgi:hypothetical protein